jgi:hypothetical protein
MSLGSESAVSASIIDSLGAGLKSEGEEWEDPAMVRRLKPKMPVGRGRRRAR